MGERPHLVILGSGFAAFSVLEKVRSALYDITVVSPRNHFLFTPLLPSTTVGTIELRSITEPMRKAYPRIRFVQGQATALDAQRRVVTCESVEPGLSFEQPYDRLVVAIGAESNTFGVAGVREHTLFLKELADARAIRERIISCLERAEVPGISPERRAQLLHFVVVGGGPTGVEFAAECHDLVQHDLAQTYPDLVGQIRITLVEGSRSILSSFDVELREYATRHFSRQGIEVRVESRVAAVQDGCLTLKSGEEMRAGLIVWSTGNAMRPFVADLCVAKDQAGRLLTDEYLRLGEHPQIYGIGDCATVSGTVIPQTAQAAMQEGFYLGKALNRLARGKQAAAFAYRRLGMLAYIGDREALADIAAVNVRLKGAATFLFWRSAYLTRLVSFKNKVLVLFDWIKASVFGRDLSKF